MGFGNKFNSDDYVFCSYLNDDNTTKSGYFYIIDINVNTITLKTLGGNIILMPFTRVLKLKKEISR